MRVKGGGALPPGKVSGIPLATSLRLALEQHPIMVSGVL